MTVEKRMVPSALVEDRNHPDDEPMGKSDFGVLK